MPKKKKNKLNIKELLIEYLANITDDNRRVEILSEFKEHIKRKKNFQDFTRFVVLNKIKGNAFYHLITLPRLTNSACLQDEFLSFLRMIIDGKVDEVKLYSKFDINMKCNPHGETLLFLARKCQLHDLETLLSNKDAVALVFQNQAAIKNKTNSRHVVELLECISRANEISKQKRLYKEKLLVHSSSNRRKKSLGDLLNVFKECIFLENVSLKSQLDLEIDILYQDEMFNMIINYLALASLGEIGKKVECNNTQQPKGFKVLCLDRVDLSFLCESNSELDTYGLYTCKETAYVATRNKDIKDILATIMHESMHYIINKLYNRNGIPSDNDQTNMELYQHIKNPNSMKKNDDAIHGRAFMCLLSIFLYDESLYTSEIFVRFLEVMVYLGPAQGKLWLSENLPELYQYFQDNLLNRLSSRLNQHLSSMTLLNVSIGNFGLLTQNNTIHDNRDQTQTLGTITPAR